MSDEIQPVVPEETENLESLIAAVRLAWAERDRAWSEYNRAITGWHKAETEKAKVEADCETLRLTATNNAKWYAAEQSARELAEARLAFLRETVRMTLARVGSVQWTADGDRWMSLSTLEEHDLEALRSALTVEPSDGECAILDSSSE